MGTTPEPGKAVCSTCHEPLSADGDCLACLLRGGLAATVTEEAPPPAPVFGDFEVTRRPDGSLWELGRGAMGVTYRARDRVLHRHVALKVINASGGSDGGRAVRERFLREARAAASLRHENVADIFQFGAAPEGGSCFYAMELVEGETLEARVRRGGPLAAGTALEIASQVAAALVAAAAKGLVHRDLKPGNLMLTSGALEVKVVDFGLAKAVAASPTEADLTRGGFVGTPAYASPEQFGRGTVDARSDLYSLGVTLWYALTGRAPFAGRTLDELRDDPGREQLPVEQLTARRVPAPVVGLLRRVLAVDPAGRPASARELLDALETCRGQLGVARPGKRSSPVRAGRPAALPWLAAAAGALVLLAAVWGAWGRFGHRGKPGTDLALAVPLEKSIAVLPFDNLGDTDNKWFTEGIQDEILCDLAKIADLKVISHTSVLAFVPSHAGNVREIGRGLGVTHLLEGRVARAEGRVHVSATLIDARTDGQVEWADSYNEELAGIFQIQSKIAESIAGSLRAKLSSAEKAAIDTRPTADLDAYDDYLRAKQLVDTYPQTADWRATLLRAVRLLDDATARDGRFALAYCLAAEAHGFLYHTGLDPTPARLAQQERATATALRLQPNLGEARLARARWLYRGEHDFADARTELAAARAALPNDAEVLLMLSFMDRREGRWPEAQNNQEKATSLDPSNYTILTEQLVLYDRMRLYAEELRTADAGIASLPSSADYLRLMKAQIFLEAGRSRAARGVLATLPAGYDPNGATTFTRVNAALYDGRPEEAAALLAGFHGDEYPGPTGEMVSRVWLEASVARAAGDGERTRRALAQAREQAAASVAQHPDDPAALALLGLADAGLGHKEDALREGQRAVGMLPVSTDAMDGPPLAGTLALICAWVGEPEAAMTHLLGMAGRPAGPDYGQLRYDPAWSSLRERKDFQAMLTQLDPRLSP